MTEVLHTTVPVHFHPDLAVLLHKRGGRPGSSVFLSFQAESTNVYQTILEVELRQLIDALKTT